MVASLSDKFAVIVAGLLCLATALLPAGGLRADEALSPTSALARLFTAPKLEPQWFAPEFLAESPIARLEQISRNLVDQHGPFQSVKEASSRLFVTFERATIPARIALDESGRISTLFVGPPVPPSLAAAVAPFDALPGQVAVLVEEDGRELVARNADTPLGVGSAFKMLVLHELEGAIADGRLAWPQVVDLRAAWKAPGSGLVGAWPEGTPVTLAALATLMISQSDNTATDALMELVGRARLDRVTPTAARPLLSTRELLTLRFWSPLDLLAQWRTGTLTDREAVRTALHDVPVAAVNRPSEDTADIDYHFTARELCALIDSLSNSPTMRVNPGVADGNTVPVGWDWVAYKGGSTTTSINLTTLAAKGERRYCIATTWNATPFVNQTRFIALTRSLQFFLFGVPR